MSPAVCITVVGDALLDRDLDGAVERVAPDAPVPVVDSIDTRLRPGGAALAATFAQTAGADVRLVTALGRDDAGDELRSMLAAQAIEIIDLGRSATSEKTRVRAGGQVLVRVDRGGDAHTGPMNAHAFDALSDADAVLVADYGAGVVRAAHDALAHVTPRPLIWDPHPRGETPVAAATIATPNFREACLFAGTAFADASSVAVATDAARLLRTTWRAAAVAVTMGDLGAVLVDGSSLPLVVPSVQPERGDACGAGDCFAAHLATGLAARSLPSEAVATAVRAAGAYVAQRGPRSDASSRSGRVVATSGCFDLLHAGHVQMLHAARRLGDRLVVLLNSDASVRRLKGPRRPIVPEADRASLLRALACVDDVVIFGEDTPAQALERLRPNIFVKGGDYGARDIPESRVLAAWGGRAVVVPYLQGRSTTALAKEAMHAQRA